jgi:acetylornithine deacetylase/succinyl-diaminopimelate desuccinylase-like protein
MDALATLIDWLRIPSISSDPAHNADTRRAAEFAADLLKNLDHVELIESPGRHPLVYADWLHAPGRPTLLFYGHYDVQPPEPLDEWHSPPFEPTLRRDPHLPGANIYARGAADDKGLALTLIWAVRQLVEERGSLPVNVRFLIEGEEESGGEHIEQFVAEHPERLAADAAVIADTEMFAPELPTLCVGLRGIVYGEIHVEGARTDLHSGVYGGAAPNPLQAMAEIITALKGRNGHIEIPGFYERVSPPSPLERAAWARLPFDEADYLAREVGSAELTGEPGIGLFERLWARPTFEVHGIRGGFIGEGAKTVIPARAVAKVSFRLVADQQPAEAVEQIERAMAAATPRGVRASFQLLHAAAPSLVDTSNLYIQEAAQAMTETFGVETVFTRSGGSIPVVGLFDQHLHIPSIMLGFGLPDDNLHAPNEKLYLPNFFRGIDATRRLIERIGALRST